MLKGEIEILASIVLNKATVKQLITSRMARNNSFVNATINSLLKKNYIHAKKTHGFQITNKGIKALKEFYPRHPALNRAIQMRLSRKHSSETGNAIKMIEQLKNNYDMKIYSVNNLHENNISN